MIWTLKAHLNFAGFKPSNMQIKKIIDSLSDETRERKGFAITLDEKSHVKSRVETSAMNEDGQVSADYLTRRYSELIENPFFARKDCHSRHRASEGQNRARKAA